MRSIEESNMEVLFWMSTSFHTTSRHLLIAIIEQLNKSGNNVTVLKKSYLGEEEDIPNELGNKGVKFISITLKRPKKSSFSARYINDLLYMIKCRKVMKRNYDAVFLQSSNVAGIAFQILRKRQKNAIKTFNVQDAFPENAAIRGVLKGRGLRFRILKRIQRNAYRYSDHIITISEDIKNHLVKEWKINPSIIEVIYNWSYRDEVYDNSTFDRAAISKIFKRGYFNVVYAGNIGVMQNVDVIVEAANYLKKEKDIWFYIIGNGLYCGKLKSKANSYGITNISFLPMQPAELAPSIYGLADANIIPLKKGVFETALPSKTATCLACQKPIVFALGKESLFGRRVREETGCYLVDSDDFISLADSIISIKEGTTRVCTSEFFVNNMSKSMNSRKYSDIIIRR